MINNGFDIFILLSLFLLLSLFEYRRVNKSRLLIRLISIGIICLSLYSILYPPTYFTNYESKTGILLTTSTNRSSLDSLIREYPLAPIVFLEEKSGTYPAVADVSALKRHFAQIQKWLVLGDGLSKNEIDELSNRSLEFHLNPIPDGISRIDFPDRIHAGESIEISGEYLNQTGDASWLYFNFEEQLIDSLELKKGKNSFRFTNHFKTSGQFKLTFTIKSAASEILDEETLYIPVYKQDIASILILSLFPGFEERQLKNHLAKVHNKIAWRSKTSKVAYRYEAINRSGFAQKQITKHFLSQFQLIIVHSDLLNSLKKEELNYLEQSIENSGLGLLIMWDKQFKEQQWLNFRFLKFNDNYFTFPVTEFNQITDIKLKAAPFSIQHSEDQIPLLVTKKGRIASAYRQHGLGRIGLLMARDIYSLKFKEQESAYTKIWSLLIKSVLKSDMTNQIRSNQKINFINQPSEFELLSLENQPELLINSVDEMIAVYLMQSLFDETAWSGIYWAKKEGWHQISSQIDTVNKVDQYIYSNQDWKSLQIAQNQATNIDQHISSPELNGLQKEIEINRIWFYILFLISVLFIWIEEKI